MPKAPKVDGDEWFDIIKTKSARVIAQILKKQPELVNYKDNRNINVPSWAVPNDRSITSLICAVQNDKIQVVKLLIDAGADIEAKDRFDTTPLMWAIDKNFEKVAMLLIKSGAEVNGPGTYIGTTLAYAAYSGNINIAKVLIEKGADVNPNPRFGFSPLFRAISEDHYDMVKLLIENGADIRKTYGSDDRICLTHTGCILESTRIAKLLIENGADVNHMSSYNETPLFCAIKFSNLNLVKLLIESGANVNLRDRRGKTPLMLASMYGNPEIVELLIDNGADVNALDEDSCSPLINAARHARPLAARVLLDRGADINARNDENRSAMDYTIFFRHHPDAIYEFDEAEFRNDERIENDVQEMFMFLRSRLPNSNHSCVNCNPPSFSLEPSKIDLLGTNELPILLKKGSS